MSKCDVVAVGVNPETGVICQMIDTECMAAPEGATVHTDGDGSMYWCRPFVRDSHADALRALRFTRDALEKWMGYAGAGDPEHCARKGWQWVLDEADAVLAKAAGR